MLHTVEFHPTAGKLQSVSYRFTKGMPPAQLRQTMSESKATLVAQFKDQSWAPQVKNTKRNGKEFVVITLTRR